MIIFFKNSKVIEQIFHLYFLFSGPLCSHSFEDHKYLQQLERVERDYYLMPVDEWNRFVTSFQTKYNLLMKTTDLDENKQNMTSIKYEIDSLTNGAGLIGNKNTIN